MSKCNVLPAHILIKKLLERHGDRDIKRQVLALLNYV